MAIRGSVHLVESLRTTGKLVHCTLLQLTPLSGIFDNIL